MAATPDFQSARPTPPWRQRLGAFWRWWTAEIAAMVPERLSMLGGAARVPILAFEGDEIALLEPHLSSGESRVNLAALDEARRGAAVRALLERGGETRARARLALGHGEALMRRVKLPAATEENLSQVLAFEMDRLTPFKADEVYFDHRVVARDAQAAQIEVQVAMARREVVDAQVERLRRLGVSVQGVAIRDDLGHAGSGTLDLLPSEQRGERETARERVVQRSLAVAAVALLALVLLLPVWQKREAIIALHPVLAKAKQEAESTDAVARELERQANDYNFLLARKHGTPTVLAIIEEVSRLLPDNTWVQQLEVKTTGKTREVQITGETSSSSKLIEILEQSKLMQNAAPRGTVTRGSLPNTERFMIAAEVRPRTPPDSRPLLEAVAALPNPSSLPPAPTPNVAVAPAPGASAPTATVTPVPPAKAPPPVPQPKAPPAKPGPAGK